MNASYWRFTILFSARDAEKLEDDETNDQTFFHLLKEQFSLENFRAIEQDGITLLKRLYEILGYALQLNSIRHFEIG